MIKLPKNKCFCTVSWIDLKTDEMDFRLTHLMNNKSEPFAHSQRWPCQLKSIETAHPLLTLSLPYFHLWRKSNFGMLTGDKLVGKVKHFYTDLRKRNLVKIRKTKI